MKTCQIINFLTILILFMTPLTSNAETEPATQLPPDRVFTIGFAQDDLSNDWRAAQVRDLQNALADYQTHVKLIITDAKGQTAQQIKDIEDLSYQGIDMLITSPRDAQAMTPVISRIYQQGIPVILLSRRILNDDYTIFIGASNRTIGEQAAQFFAEYTQKNPLNIVILQHIPTSTPGIERTQGFLTRAKHYPQLNIVAIKPADSLRALAIQAIEQILADDIAFNAIYAQSDSMASGARLALLQAGIDPATIPTVGIDYIAEAQQAIQAGQQTASFTYPTFGAEGAYYALRLLQGKPVPKEVMVESILVTQTNVDNVEPIF